MSRPHKHKIVENIPNVTFFKPQGIPLRTLEQVTLTIEELETLRLANLENLSQSQAATQMNIHQSTFQRTLKKARTKVSDALVNGKAIRIQGGNYVQQLQDSDEDMCMCPECKTEVPHQKGTPCRLTECPECGSRMKRK